MLFLLPLFAIETYINDSTYENHLEMYVSIWDRFGPESIGAIDFLEELKLLDTSHHEYYIRMNISGEVTNNPSKDLKKYWSEDYSYFQIEDVSLYIS